MLIDQQPMPRSHSAKFELLCVPKYHTGKCEVICSKARSLAVFWSYNRTIIRSTNLQNGLKINMNNVLELPNQSPNLNWTEILRQDLKELYLNVKNLNECHSTMGVLSIVQNIHSYLNWLNFFKESHVVCLRLYLLCTDPLQSEYLHTFTHSNT